MSWILIARISVTVIGVTTFGSRQGGVAAFIDQGTVGSFSLEKIDADTFQRLGLWNSQRNFLNMPEIGRDSISDQKIVSTGNNFTLFICDIDRPWPTASDSPFRLVADPNWREIYHVKRGLIGLPTFISNDLIALSSSREVGLLRTDGTVLYEDRPARWPNYLGGNAVGSSNGRRFAVRIATLSLNLSDFSINRFKRVVVYDSRERRAVFELNHKPACMENVSLSPDSTILAVDYGSSLEDFRLPQ